MSCVLDSVRQFCAQHPQFKKFIVALSGGRDSVVLLHALSQVVPANALIAVHVHHGLQEAADEFLSWCKLYCAQLQISFQVKYVRVNGDQGLEANARKARYEALASFLQTETTCLLTGHHQLDQCLTLLLQLGRGAGLDGLVAMPPLMPFGPGWHGRPLLGLSSNAILTYARKAQLSWIEDPTNRDLRWKRNYLRQQVWPEFLKAFPGAEKSIARSSRHLQMSLSLCEEIAQQDLLRLEPATTSVSFPPLLQLSWARQVNVLRFWLKSLTKNTSRQLPNSKRLEEFLRQLQHLKKDKRATLQWAGQQLVYSCERLDYRVATPITLESDFSTCTWQWNLQEECLLPNGLVLNSRYLQDLGIDLSKLQPPLTIKYRQGGEKYYSSRLNKKRALKKWLQEHKISHWQRETTPLLFQGQQLVAMLGLIVSDDFKTGDLLKCDPILVSETTIFSLEK